MAHLGLNKDSIQFILSHVNGDCIIYSREFGQVLYHTCMMPFIRPSLPQLSTKDIVIQRELEKQLKVAQKNKTSIKKWGNASQNAAVAQGLLGYERDLKKFDEFKRIKEQCVKNPAQPRNAFLKLANKEEAKRNQHRNAFQGSTSLSPVRGSNGHMQQKDQGSVGPAMLLLSENVVSASKSFN